MKLSGLVIRKTFGKGSKSEHEAIYLQTDRGAERASPTGRSNKEEYVLRRRGANPFSDPVLDDLVGKTISATGTIKEYVFFVDEWEVI
jgi:hypothetical protein